eukprot:2254644-Amphidinium_carterae.1
MEIASQCTDVDTINYYCHSSGRTCTTSCIAFLLSCWGLLVQVSGYLRKTCCKNASKCFIIKLDAVTLREHMDQVKPCVTILSGVPSQCEENVRMGGFVSLDWVRVVGICLCQPLRMRPW